MDVLIKEAKRMGNGAGIYVPKEWANKAVVVSLLSPREQILEAINPYLEHVISVGLYGSLTRGEGSTDSDIDVLVISDKEIPPKNRQHLDLLDMIVVSKKEVDTILSQDPMQLAPVILESQPLINESYLNALKTKVETIKPRKYLPVITETEGRLRTYTQMIEDRKKLPPIIYSLIMRLRALYLIDLMIKGKKYTNIDFQKHATKMGIKNESYESLHMIYRCVRDVKQLPAKIVTLEEIIKLHEVVGRETKRVREVIENAK